MSDPLTADAICALVRDFLAERIPSGRDGGYAPVTVEQMDALDTIIYAIIEAKWEQDIDRDLPVCYDTWDRTRYWKPFSPPIPHTTSLNTNAERLDALGCVLGSLSSMMDRAKIEVECLRRRLLLEEAPASLLLALDKLKETDA